MDEQPEAGVGRNAAPTKIKQSLYAASEWKLIWLQFRKNKAAVFSAVVLLIMYLVALFAGFFAPYDPYSQHLEHIFMRPQKLHLMDERGLHAPFVYGIDAELDMETFNRLYEENTAEKYRLKLFARGDRYKLWGLFETNVHFLGVEDGGVLFLFGTDQLGRDILSRIIFGSRISLSIGLVGVFLSIVLGLVIGSVSGYFGGWIDNAIQRFIEIIRSFPRIPLWMSLSAALPVTWSSAKIYFGITVVLSLVGWTGLARVARGKVLSIKSEDFITAARISGISEVRIILTYLIPSFMSHIIATTTLAIPGMILGETSLSFLGIGLRPPTISWGVLLKQAQNVHTLAIAPWLMIPGVFVIVVVLAFNFLGDGLRDSADPYKL